MRSYRTFFPSTRVAVLGSLRSSAPRRVAEMDDEIGVVGNDGVVERQRADAAPATKRPLLRERRPARLPFVGHLDVERQRAFRGRVAPIEDLRHDLVAEIELRARNARLMLGDQQAHELGRARRSSFRLAELGDRVQLTDARFAVDIAERQAHFQQKRRARGTSRRRRVGSVAQFDIVDVLRVTAADVLLSDEVGRSKRRGVLRIRCWKELAHHGQRATNAAPRLRAARRVPPNRERRAPLAEVTRVVRRLGDPPLSDETQSVRMHQTVPALAIGTPAQVRARIQRALTGLSEEVRLADRDQAAEHAIERDLVGGQRRFAVPAPHPLIRVREKRVDDFAKRGARVRTVLFG